MWKKYGKRSFDLAFCLLAFPFLVPALATIALVLKIKIGGPVLFAHERIGFRGKSFTLWKFRSMTNARDAQGRLLPDAARLTKLGKLLRASSMDELPSFWNVVKGEMSVVGPRPLLPQYLGRYSAEQFRRHEVLPGITGWAQVNGRNAISWEEKFKCDVWYVDHISFTVDLWILLKTLGKTIVRDGINHPGEATMHEFVGAASQEGNN
jgi:sugar transferase EpsL